MNIIIIIIWLIFIILTIIYIVITIITLKKYKKYKSVISESEENNCTVAINNLINIENDKCCVKNNLITASRYVPELNMVVNPVAVPYLNVCIEYCGYDGYDEEKMSCKNIENQKEFENCIEITKPVNCIGYSMPVAVLNTTYYYPNSATDINCEDKIEC